MKVNRRYVNTICIILITSNAPLHSLTCSQPLSVHVSLVLSNLLQKKHILKQHCIFAHLCNSAIALFFFVYFLKNIPNNTVYKNMLHLIKSKNQHTIIYKYFITLDEDEFSDISPL